MHKLCYISKKNQQMFLKVNSKVKDQLILSLMEHKEITIIFNQ